MAFCWKGNNTYHLQRWWCCALTLKPGLELGWAWHVHKLTDRTVICVWHLPNFCLCFFWVGASCRYSWSCNIFNCLVFEGEDNFYSCFWFSCCFKGLQVQPNRQKWICWTEEFQSQVRNTSLMNMWCSRMNASEKADFQLWYRVPFVSPFESCQIQHRHNSSDNLAFVFAWWSLCACWLWQWNWESV